jgi:hypothetical protein
MGGWRYVAFWLLISAVCGLWLIHKTNSDRKGLAVWQETNIKLDKIISILERE